MVYEKKCCNGPESDDTICNHKKQNKDKYDPYLYFRGNLSHG